MVKDTFYTHSQLAKAEKERQRKEKEETEKRFKDIQQKKEQERLAQDFEPATVTELTEQEAEDMQKDIEESKNKSNIYYHLYLLARENLTGLTVFSRRQVKPFC